jgi:arabinogalactan oligomer/maltooligosaccharide transport system permease protein
MSELIDAFNFDQAALAVGEVASSLFWIVLAIVALEAFLYLLLMARRDTPRMTGLALALPMVILAVAIVLNTEWSVDMLVSLVVALLILGGVEALVYLAAIDGRDDRRPALVAGAVPLVVLAVAWVGQPLLGGGELDVNALILLAVVLLVFAGIEALLYRIGRRRQGQSHRLALTIMLLAPALVGIAILYVYPLYYELSLSFTKMNIRNFVDPGLFFGLTMEGTPLEPWGAERDIFIGIQNYVDVFTKPVLKQTGFWQLLAQTLIFTSVTIFFHVTLGIMLALMLNRKLRGRTIYRALIILPWAIPVFISLQIWRTEYNFQFGAVNQVLAIFGIAPQQWLSDPVMNFLALIITNIWLGVPFMMVITLGGLQAISSDYYEAAEIDGASGRQQFFAITLPLLRPVLVPAVLLGVFLTFNNINVPFFINQNELETSDILVTALYRAGFQFSRFGFAAAFAFVVFAILLVFTIWYVRQTKILKGSFES